MHVRCSAQKAMRAVALALVMVVVAVGCGDDADDGSHGGGDRDASARGDAAADAANPDAPDAAPLANQPGTRIAIADGELQGEAIDGARRFLGIPFAKPPVGALRWQAAEQNEPWTGVRDATEFGGRCPQLASLQAPTSTDEDCLYLNVWSPEPAPDAPVPVMFWIHGGGNTSGSAGDEVPSQPGHLFYDGQRFAEEYGVVVVSTNYRLGALGFFSHPALREEGGATGNQGLLDQRMALQWVQDNIAAFGGDPENVTVFGESAGSFDTCFHVASPGSAGLFHRAISQSGGCTTKVSSLEEAEARAAAFVEHVGCDGADDVLACLRDVPVSELIAAPPVDGADTTLPGGSRYQGGMPRWRFGPVVDGVVLPDQPRALFDAGDVANVPYMLGSTADEGTLFHLGAVPVADEAEYMAALERRFGDRAADVAALYPVADFDSADAALQRVTGDSGLVCGTYDTALRAAEAGLDVYMYNFDQPSVTQGLAFLGAAHGSEIVFVFGSLPGQTEDEIRVRDAMQGYWSRFAASGDPNGDGALEWPKFSAASDVRMNFTPEPTLVDDFRAEQCALFRELYDADFEAQ